MHLQLGPVHLRSTTTRVNWRDLELVCVTGKGSSRVETGIHVGYRWGFSIPDGGTPIPQPEPGATAANDPFVIVK